MFNLPEEMRRAINWSHERGSWQYDLLCLLIIAVIFLAPGRFFGDRDRPESTTHAVPAAIDPVGVIQMEIEAAELGSFLQGQRRADLTDFPVEALGFYLREQYNHRVRLLRYEQFVDSRQKTGYRVWFEKDDPIR